MHLVGYMLELNTSILSCIPLQLSTHFSHTHACSDTIVKTLISDKHFGLVDTGKWVLKGNTTVGRARKTLSAISPIMYRTLYKDCMWLHCFDIYQMLMQ